MFFSSGFQNTLSATGVRTFQVQQHIPESLFVQNRRRIALKYVNVIS